MATTPLPVPKPPVSSTVIDTGIPGIGSIDYSNPIEIAIWGGIGASIFFAPGIWKLIIPAGLLVARWQMSKIEL